MRVCLLCFFFYRPCRLGSATASRIRCRRRSAAWARRDRRLRRCTGTAALQATSARKGHRQARKGECALRQERRLRATHVRFRGRGVGGGPGCDHGDEKAGAVKPCGKRALRPGLRVRRAQRADRLLLLLGQRDARLPRRRRPHRRRQIVRLVAPLEGKRSAPPTRPPHRQRSLPFAFRPSLRIALLAAHRVMPIENAPVRHRSCAGRQRRAASRRRRRRRCSGARNATRRRRRRERERERRAAENPCEHPRRSRR